LRNKAGWPWGIVSAIDFRGRTIWIADAHCDDGKRFVVRANEKLTAFLELEKVTRNDSDRNQTAPNYLRDLPQIKHLWSKIEASLPNNDLKISPP